MKNLQYVLEEVEIERYNQDCKWGEQNHSPAEWCLILGEEVGEVNKAALESHFKYAVGADLADYRQELIQVAAVAVAMIQSLDRNELGPLVQDETGPHPDDVTFSDSGSVKKLVHTKALLKRMKACGGGDGTNK